ncbi:MAG: hydroxyacid dehydrogenase [Anaerolineae bacterium]|nr:hydroxyacid dehydrogenase [Anaerolineae bacterium]
MNSKPKIWLESIIQIATLERLHDFADIVRGDTPESIQGCDAAVISSRPNVNGAWLDAAGPTLKVVARPGIGVDNITISDASARGVLVMNTPDAPTESTAEHTVALMMAIAKRVVTADVHLRGNNAMSSTITRNMLKGTEMKGKTLGIIGLGRIGKRVAEMAAFGIRMNVIGYDPYAKPGSVPGVEFVDSLDTLLARADFVSLNAALTKETYKSFNEARFRQMKRGAYFINCSRGGTVDEDALYKVLVEGHLAGAALDVFDPEPPLPNNPLLTLPNVVVTMHIASFTDVGTDSMGNGVVDQLAQLFHGERPDNLIDGAAWPGRAAAIAKI